MMYFVYVLALIGWLAIGVAFIKIADEIHGRGRSDSYLVLHASVFGPLAVCLLPTAYAMRRRWI